MASWRRGNDGRGAICPGIWRERPAGRAAAAPSTGLADGEGGMARPRRGVRAPPLEREPGIGGRRRGAGEDILGGCCGKGSMLCVG